MSKPEAFSTFLVKQQNRIEHHLDALLSHQYIHSPDLLEAMRYSTLGGGKRLRPVLAYAAAQALGHSLECCDIPACCVELIHVYSLIHDDLPPMDDDDLRRGKPTCHRAFDEATAILAGDGLQSLAFYLLSQSPLLEVSPSTRLTMLVTLSEAAGTQGMVSGQMFDLSAVGKTLSLRDLEAMHRHKTGALIRASVRLGALATQAVDEAQLSALDLYADCLGLAFQVHDDILDVESSTDVLGKTQGADISKNKPTYPALLGMHEAKNKRDALISQAHDALAIFKTTHAHSLHALADYVKNRSF